MMSRLICLEVRKSLRNKWFYISISIAIVLAIASAFGCLQQDLRDRALYEAFLESHYYPFTTLSVFRYWMMIDSSQAATDLFFMLLPLLALMPFSWSLSSEKVSGYSAHIVARTNRLRYYIAKHLAAFVSGGIVVTAPLLLNFIVCMCFAPFYMPEINGVVTIGVFETSLWSDIFYSNPGLYCMLRIMLVFAFGGVWSSFVMVLSHFVKGILPLLIAPFLFLIGLKMLNGLVLLPIFGIADDLTPFGYLRSVPSSGMLTSWTVIAFEFAAMIVIVAASIVMKRKSDVL